jgi:hypothetical protein
MKVSRYHLPLVIALLALALLALPNPAQADAVVPTDTPLPTDTPEPTNTPIPTNTFAPTLAPTDTPQNGSGLTGIQVTPTPATGSASGIRGNLLNYCLVGVIAISILTAIGIVAYQGYIRSAGQT